jgi:hypothetical protein
MRMLFLSLLTSCALVGCASHTVTCRGPLQPINARQVAQEGDAPPAVSQSARLPRGE